MKWKDGTYETRQYVSHACMPYKGCAIHSALINSCTTFVVTRITANRKGSKKNPKYRIIMTNLNHELPQKD